MASAVEPPGRPRPGLFLLEGRALLELAACVAAYPVLRRAPAGDGHPVLVLPGFLASDFSTRTLRAFLRGRGYRAHGWKLGRNLGPRAETVEGLVGRLRDLRERHGRALSLVGWSLGGIYARELARRFPADVRQVITLGSPFRDLEATNVPRFLRAMAERRRLPETDAVRGHLAAPLPVPSTAIFSRTDAIAAWPSCCETSGPQRESIEVESSHLGLGHHPVVLLTIADRLAQPEGTWRPFVPPPGIRWPFVPRTTAG
jgi:pimeloyl-ACP methyl ester carboxylesterase